MYKYEMDPTKTVGATERTQDVGQTDGRKDGGRTVGRSETNIPPQQLCCAGVIMKNKINIHEKTVGGIYASNKVKLNIRHP